MTNAELRKLDARVHREVMGRSCDWISDPTGWNTEKDWRWEEIEITPAATYHRTAPIPAYSTDIAAAWRVVEKMADKGHYVDIASYPSGNFGSVLI